MASSSVSQESLDREDYEMNTRRSRIRTLRSRTAHNKNESVETTDDKDLDGEDMQDLSLGPSPGHVTFAPPGAGAAAGEHESPTRLNTRMKDKRIRPTHMHMHKGKTAKDKRKLREKRRSTGVVHLQNAAESTGDSLDEADKESEVTRRNTSCNEVIDADNPQTPEEERKIFAVRRVRNKSPSDLDADLEDNQDYDSTVSQSETNLTTIVAGTPLQGDGSTSSCVRPIPRPIPHPAGAPPSISERFHEAELIPRSIGAMAASGGRTRDHHHHHHHRHQEVLDTKLLSRNVDLERQLECEREENRRLQELLDERERHISQLEKQVAVMNKDIQIIDAEHEKTQLENRVLLRAMAALTAE
ncbi:hypothetical protein CAPTEDRAFT_221870 [Capitella teleta]|uniref:PRKC apoptosis WT1 regulator protein n=1 Tax=Capitella teleta TaxID=283909 RepID=R7UT68_CAPTE|nr:hypothetical protein CAPTEDRAFT_221870 [Capitella teleta]|eukprot:ELU09368.1 hypothetical protein CAPTEDRAFT_221870 [Capitella teleta]